jgi:hypothetical protein
MGDANHTSAAASFMGTKRADHRPNNRCHQGKNSFPFEPRRSHLPPTFILNIISSSSVFVISICCVCVLRLVRVGGRESRFF